MTRYSFYHSRADKLSCISLSKLRCLYFLLLSLCLGLICLPACQAPQQNASEAVLADTTQQTDEASGRWSEEKTRAWYEEQPWLVGCNFIPSNAINQLEMWQAATFSPELIDKELGLAESLGFNAVRVYLHHLAWQEDEPGFKQRMKDYLAIAEQHRIKTLFVFFDDVWNDTYQAGKQPAPKPGTHNSGWVQDPGKMIHEDSAKVYPVLEAYVKDILSSFQADERVLAWDLYNEPGNSGHGNQSLPLLKSVFAWGRAINPSQPLTVGVWKLELEELNAYQLAHSDVISYHNYGDKADHQQWIKDLQKYRRPMLCTEYMARSRKSTFEQILPLLKQDSIAAFNWGLVSGKTNTIYAWDTPIKDGSEPKIWFHDIFRGDGSAYLEEEVAFIQEVMGVGNKE